MSKILEVEFEDKESLLEAIGDTDKPLVVGNISTFYKDVGAVEQTVKMSTFDSIGNCPVVFSWRVRVGQEKLVTEERAEYMDEKMQRAQQLRIDELQRKTDEVKTKLAAELREMKYEVFFGIIKEHEN